MVVQPLLGNNAGVSAGKRGRGLGGCFWQLLRSTDAVVPGGAELMGLSIRGAKPLTSVI